MDVFYRPPFPWYHFLLGVVGDRFELFDDTYNRTPFFRLLAREEGNRLNIERANRKVDTGDP